MAMDSKHQFIAFIEIDTEDLGLRSLVIEFLNQKFIEK